MSNLVSHMRTSAEAGNPDAQFNLAVILGNGFDDHGRFIGAQREEALTWLRLCAAGQLHGRALVQAAAASQRLGALRLAAQHARGLEERQRTARSQVRAAIAVAVALAAAAAAAHAGSSLLQKC